MTTNILGSVCILSYLIASLIPVLKLFSHKNVNECIFSLFSLIALALHFSLLTTSLSFFHVDLVFSVNNVFSITTFIIAALVFSLGFFTPLHHLSSVAYPIAIGGILSLLMPPLAFSQPMAQRREILVHLILSLSAFSFLCMAALQALFTAGQDKLLKHHYHLEFLQRLPSLQHMERIVFQLIVTGTLLLTAALGITIPLGLDVLLGEAIAPKLILSLVAWLLFSSLLIGHYIFGWRGRTAIRWTLVATLLLSLSYFGTKILL